MQHSQSITNISVALLEAQKKIGAAKKGSTNPFFHSTYASLGDVMEACKDVLNENGITVLQPINGNFVETVLLHSSGEWITSETPIVSKVTTTKKDNGDFVTTLSDPQATGSAISYARRYGLQSMLFIPAEDDDAERAVSRESSPVQTSNPVVTEEVDDDSPLYKFCDTHGEDMPRAWSTNKNKYYWSHKNEDEEICFGFGYKSRS